MDIEKKMQILGAAAKYDVSCSSSGSRRPTPQGGSGNGVSAGICHSWADDGRCISLLKTLFTNVCIHDCAYCVNRRSNDIPRAAFTVDEICELTMEFYRRNYIEGLFLSSGVMRNADYTMERLTLVAKKLRDEHRFGGYIHLKAIPGASRELIRQAGLHADRISVNIELPTEKSLLLLTDKKKDDIMLPMGEISTAIVENRDERKHLRSAPRFAPAGQSTQLIVGATPENDHQIVRLSEGLYNHYGLKRVYYSAFVPVSSDNRLPALATPPLLREHRLYQADWLMRYYGFAAGEILDDRTPFLDEEMDPKSAWALRNMHLFPIDIQTAPYESLLRVPGIGVRSAQRIVIARRHSRLGYGDLKKIGVVMKRAKHFLTVGGRMLLPGSGRPLRLIRRDLVTRAMLEPSRQLSLFPA